MRNKMLYVEPEMDILELTEADVVCASSGISDDANEEPETPIEDSDEYGTITWI